MKKAYNFKTENTYIKYLKKAGEMGQMTPEDVQFWTRVNLRVKANPSYNPYKYVYRIRIHKSDLK